MKKGFNMYLFETTTSAWQTGLVFGFRYPWIVDRGIMIPRDTHYVVVVNTNYQLKYNTQFTRRNLPQPDKLFKEVVKLTHFKENTADDLLSDLLITKESYAKITNINNYNRMVRYFESGSIPSVVGTSNVSLEVCSISPSATLSGFNYSEVGILTKPALQLYINYYNDVSRHDYLRLVINSQNNVFVWDNKNEIFLDSSRRYVQDIQKPYESMHNDIVRDNMVDILFIA